MRSHSRGARSYRSARLRISMGGRPLGAPELIARRWVPSSARHAERRPASKIQAPDLLQIGRVGLMAGTWITASKQSAIELHAR